MARQSLFTKRKRESISKYQVQPESLPKSLTESERIELANSLNEYITSESERTSVGFSKFISKTDIYSYDYADFEAGLTVADALGYPICYDRLTFAYGYAVGKYKSQSRSIESDAVTDDGV